MDSMKIRLAEAGDAAAVAEVRVDVAALDRWAALLRTFYSRDMHDRFDRLVWRAEVDGEVVGMAMVGPPQDILGPWVGQLYQLRVHSDHWRKGIGTALHAACLDAWRASGVTVGVLEVWSRDDRAQAFYESHGWRPDGHTRPGEGDSSYLRLRRTIN
jgi:GNAT superfamily N-acetyltransferase